MTPEFDVIADPAVSRTEHAPYMGARIRITEACIVRGLAGVEGVISFMPDQFVLYKAEFKDPVTGYLADMPLLRHEFVVLDKPAI